jgi:putative ABC transport system permease protein
MRKLLWLSLREIFNHRQFTILFSLSLSLGLSGFIALNSFRYSIEKSLSARSKIVLGADLGLSSRLPLSKDVLELASRSLPNSATRSDMIELYSMVANSSGNSKLVQLRAIDSHFPFYGIIKMSSTQESQESIPLVVDASTTNNRAWVYPEVLVQLNLRVGDPLRIGDMEFRIAGVIVDDSAAGITTGMAPRIYIPLSQVPNTRLVTSESLAWYTSLFAIPSATDAQLKELEQSLHSSPMIPSEVDVYSHQTAGEQMGRLANYLGDYLGLVSLAALFLSSVGAIFLFKSYFSRKIPSFAILLSLGLRPNRVLILVLFQVAALGFIGSLPAICFSLLLVPIISLITRQLLPVQLDSAMDPMSILIAVATAVVGSMLVCFPTALQLKQIKPSFLFRNETIRIMPTTLPLVLFSYLPAAVTFWLMSVWQAHSWQVGSLFTATFGCSGLFFWFLVFLVLKPLEKVPKRFPSFIQISLREMVRHPSSTIISFLALSLGVLLINIVPQIEANLRGEIEHPEKSKLPSFFLFDIQEEQLPELKKLTAEFNIPLQQVSPLVRARLIAVNNQKFEKGEKQVFSREEEREARFRNRGFNLTYRNELSDSEELSEGHNFSGIFDETKGTLPEISVEKRFAQRLGLKSGDILTFDIQDVPIEGKIVNFRTVRWASFQPNFFIQFQPGVLESAPKTYLASLPDHEAAIKSSLQNTIVSKFPNISLIDVSRLASRILEISQQMTWAMHLMAGLNIVVGLFVMFSICNHQIWQRKWEMSLLKVLGYRSAQVRNIFLFQHLAIGLLAGIVGAITSLVVSFGISFVLFDGLWVWQWQAPTFSVLSLIVLSFCVSYFSSRQIFLTKANVLLRQETA